MLEVKEAVEIGERLKESFSDVTVIVKDDGFATVIAKGHTRYKQYPDEGRKINEE